MFDEVLTTVTSSPALMATGAAIGLVCLWLGWNFKGFGANRREADLKQEMLAAKASVLQLESAARGRDQQAEHIQIEYKELRANNAELHRTIDGKDKELRTVNRQVRNLTSELNAVKGMAKDADSMIMDGFDDEVAHESANDSPLAAQLKKIETAYDKLKGALIKRDDRIDELEERLQKSGSEPGKVADEISEGTDALADEVRELRGQVEQRNQSIEELRSQVSELREEKEMLEEIASRRSKTNRALKDASAGIKEQETALQDKIQACETTIVDREASISRLLGDVETAKAQLSHQQSEAQRLQEKFDAKTSELATHQGRVVQLEADISERDQQVANLDDALYAAQQGVKSAETQLETSKRLAVEQDEQFQLLNSRLQVREQAVSGLEAQIGDKNLKLAASNKQINELTQALALARTQASEATAGSDKRVEEANAELVGARTQISQLNREIEDHSANLTQQMQWMSKLKESLGERKSINGELQAKVESLSTQLEVAKAELKRQQAARQTIEAEKGVTEQAMVERQAKVEEAEAVLAEQQNANAVYTNIIAQRDLKIETLEQDLQRYKSVESDEQVEEKAIGASAEPVQVSSAPNLSNLDLPAASECGITRRYPRSNRRTRHLETKKKGPLKAQARKGRSQRAAKSVVSTSSKGKAARRNKLKASNVTGLRRYPRAS